MKHPQKKIGVVTLKESNWHYLACSGIASFFKKEWAVSFVDKKPEIYFHATSLDRQMLTDLLLNMENQQYDTIITIGSWISVESRSWIEQNNARLQQFFCGVNHPEKTILAKTPGVTGIIDDHEIRVDALQALFPHIDTVFFVYVEESNDDQSSYRKRFETDFAPDIRKLRFMFNKKGIEVKEVPLSLHDGSIVKQASIAKGMMCLFRDTCKFNTAPEIISYCNQKDIPVYASELSSVYQGAGLGFGDTGYEYGWRLAQLVQDFLVQQKEYSTLGIHAFSSLGKLRINNDCIGRQGLHFDPKTLRLIHASTTD